MARNPRVLDFASLDLNLLRVFDAIMADENLTLAAARLGKGVPAMSQALGRLRVVFNDPLFTSHGRGMRPTPRATAIAPVIRASLNQLKVGLTSEPSFNQKTAKRTFTVDLHGGTDFVIAPLLYSFAAKHAPGVSFRLLSEKATVLRNELRYGETEIALDFEMIAGDGLRSEMLYADTFCLMARKDHPAIPRNKPVSKSAVRSLQHVGLSWTRTRGDSSPSTNRLQKIGLELDIRLVVQTLGAIPPVVESSNLVALTTTRMAAHCAKRWNTEALSLDFEVEPLMVYLVWHERYDLDPGHAWLRSALKTALESV